MKSLNAYVVLNYLAFPHKTTDMHLAITRE